MTTRAIELLVRQSPAIANEVIALDARLDALQQEIEEKAGSTIARRQPLAVDLRSVIAGDPHDRMISSASATWRRILPSA